MILVQFKKKYCCFCEWIQKNVGFFKKNRNTTFKDKNARHTIGKDLE